MSKITAIVCLVLPAFFACSASGTGSSAGSSAGLQVQSRTVNVNIPDDMKMKMKMKSPRMRDAGGTNWAVCAVTAGGSWYPANTSDMMNFTVTVPLGKSYNLYVVKTWGAFTNIRIVSLGDSICLPMRRDRSGGLSALDLGALSVSSGGSVVSTNAVYAALDYLPSSNAFDRDGDGVADFAGALDQNNNGVPDVFETAANPANQGGTNVPDIFKLSVFEQATNAKGGYYYYYASALAADSDLSQYEGTPIWSNFSLIFALDTNCRQFQTNFYPSAYTNAVLEIALDDKWRNLASSNSYQDAVTNAISQMTNAGSGWNAVFTNFTATNGSVATNSSIHFFTNSSANTNVTNFYIGLTNCLISNFIYITNTGYFSNITTNLYPLVFAGATNYATNILPATNFSVAAAGIYVSTNGSDANTGAPNSPLLTIQNALDLAVSNGLPDVFIAAGVYRPGMGLGTNTEGILVSNNNLRIIGGWDSGFNTNTNFSEIDGTNTASGIGLPNIIHVTGCSNIVLNSLIVRNGLCGAAYGGGIFLDHSSGCLITNVIVSNNYSINNGGGICDYFGINNMIFGNINKNTCENDGGGVCIYYCAGDCVYADIISNTAVYSSGGLFFSWSTNCVFKGNANWNTVSVNGTAGGGGLCAWSCTNVTFSGAANNNYANLRGGGFYLDAGNYDIKLLNLAMLGNYSGSGSQNSVVFIADHSPGFVMSNCVLSGMGVNCYAIYVEGRITNHVLLNNTFMTNSVSNLYHDPLNGDTASIAQMNNTNFTGAAVAGGNTAQ